MRSTLVLAAVLALSLSACGAAPSTQNDKFKGAQQDVVKVVDALASAGTRGDADKICTEILAKQLVTELKAAGGDWGRPATGSGPAAHDRLPGGARR